MSLQKMPLRRKLAQSQLNETAENAHQKRLFSAQDPKKYLRAILKTKTQQNYIQFDNDFEIIQQRDAQAKANSLVSIMSNKKEQSADRIQIDCYNDRVLNIMVRRNIKTILQSIIEEFKKIKIVKYDRIIKDVEQVALTMKSSRIKTLIQDQEKYQQNNFQKLQVFRREKRIQDYNIERTAVYQSNINFINAKQFTKVEYKVKDIIQKKKHQIFFGE